MIIHFNIEKNEIQLNSSPIVGECMVSASVRWYFSLRRGYIWDDISRFRRFRTLNRAVSRLAANQWETSWQNNTVSRWLGANLESVQLYVSLKQYSTHRFVIYSIALPMVVYGTRWRHGMEKYSAPLTLCEGNPPVTGGFLLQRVSDADISLLSAWTCHWTTCRCFEIHWVLGKANMYLHS